MKEYLDRKRMGISQIFSEIHPIFAPNSDLNEEETVRLLCEQPRRTRHKIAVRINEGIQRLTADKTVDVEDYLNDDIRELSDYPVNEGRLLHHTFFFLQAKEGLNHLPRGLQNLFP